jgi:HK97 family phage portal protein
VARFLPVLRRSPSRKELMQAAMEAKFVLADYYSTLHRFESGRRARHWPIERAVVEGYERVIWVFKAVNTIAADHSRLPFRLRCDGQVLDDHPLYHVLNKRANKMETGQVFRKRLSAQVSLSKPGAFVEKVYSNGGTIKELHLLPPDRVDIIPGEPGSGVLIECFRLWRRDGGYRDIPPEKVLWFREPHPIDPYSGVTPLEAAGLSVELDYFARLYNVTFMRNDGRPGGVLAVKAPAGSTRASLRDDQLDRLEAKFGKGPSEAGKLSVVEGELEYVDLARSPRDAQYGQVSRTSKIELLSAYGVPESVLGYSAERTFDNADNELYVYWTRTMTAHNEIIVSGFDEDSEDDLEGFLDTSSVEVLERHERAKREEARNEVAAGLRSLKSYADLAGYGDEIDDTPHTRALYIPTGKTPLPSRKDDAIALGLEEDPAAKQTQQDQPPQLDAAQGAPALPPGPAGQDIGAPPAIGAPAAPDTGSQPAGLPPGYAPAAAAPAAIAAAPAAKAIPIGARPVLRVQRPTPTPVEQVRESALDERARDRLEDVLAAALTALSTRWLARTKARLESPKSRKGTRHWQAGDPSDTRAGTKALDAAKAVDDERWGSEAETGAKPIVEEAAAVAAAAMLVDLAGDEDNTTAPSVIVASVVAAVVRLIADSASRQAMRLARLINEADQNDESFPDIVAMVEQQMASLTSWANGVATTAATATLNGAREAAAEEIHDTTGDRVERTWLSRRDEKVRHSHHEADGQTQPLGKPFLVGDSLLRFPCDPLAPVHETANCRCRLLHRSTRTGMFVRPPAELPEAS